jgi:hypothetical protein
MHRLLGVRQARREVMMRVQTKTAESGAQSLGAGWGADTGAVLLAANQSQRLEYLCDMVGELQAMAEQGSLNRLAAILALAQDEARRQLDSR